MSTFIRFGKYLEGKGLITADAIISARLLQRGNNRKIGKLARDKGWLTEDDILRVLVIQEETGEKFGDIAVREKYLTNEQVEELLQIQSDSYMYFGEALVRIGVISDEEVKKQLQEYGRFNAEASASFDAFLSPVLKKRKRGYLQGYISESTGYTGYIEEYEREKRVGNIDHCSRNSYSLCYSP